MSRPRHYSPQICRFLVSVLYHQAKHSKIPMTKLVDDLLRQNALQGTQGWIHSNDPQTQRTDTTTTF
jgi:hypothetical protein